MPHPTAASRRSPLARALTPPVAPPRTRPFAVDAATTPRGFAWRVMRGAAAQTAIALPLLTTHQVCEALVPIVAGIAVDRAIIPGDTGQLVLWLGVLVAVFAVLATAWRLGSRVWLIGVELVQHRLREQLTDRLVRRAPDAPRLAAGEALSIATSDANRLSGAVSLTIMPLAEAAAVLVTGAVLFSISPLLGAVVLLGALALIVGLDLAARGLRDRIEQQQHLAGRAAASAADLIAGRRVLAGLGAFGAASARFEGVNARSLTASLRASSSQAGYDLGLRAASGLFVVVVAALVGWLGITGRITTGELITAAGLTAFVMSPLGMLAQNAGTAWAAAVASSRRVLAVLQAPVRIDGAAQPGDETTGPAPLTVRVGDLGFAVHRGEVLGIVAAEDDERALLALLDGDAPGSGTEPTGDAAFGATVAGVAVHDLHPDARPVALCVSPHDAPLFGGPLADVVAGGDADRAARALTAAAADDVLALLPHGLDTVLGDDALELSGGQRQRLALARAYATESAALVLVEPTTAVDAVTEALVADRIRGVRASGATLVVTASPPLLAACDRVVAVAGGRVVAEGTHADLLGDEVYRGMLA